MASGTSPLSADGTIYRNVWSNAPVCAPARTTLITGMYPTSLGAQHMRSMVPLPDGVTMFPKLLRDAGYYCSNRRKEDYNVSKPDGIWDESSSKAHWKNRADGQPFFAVINFTTTHESQIRKRPHEQVHNPEQVPVPDYHPDHPDVRRDWAQYYDKLTEMDRQVGQVLEELQADGLADDTIVFYFADHGPGLPRAKRWPINSGLQVPLIVRIPDKFKHLMPQDYAPGQKSERLIGFVDFAPTILELANVDLPDYLQGKSFLGPNPDENEYLFGFRDRMDERHDMVRSIRNKRYVLVRNYSPHLIYGQHLYYQRQTPTDRIWKQLFDEGRLPETQAFFWQSKPILEMYDLKVDPDEVDNLIRPDRPLPIEEFARMRKALDHWMLDVGDTGFWPEAELHARCGDRSPREMMLDMGREKLMRTRDVAARATDRLFDNQEALIDYLVNDEAASMQFCFRPKAGVTHRQNLETTFR